MIVVTTIEVPDYVYRYYIHEADQHIGSSPEKRMAQYLTKHVRRMNLRKGRPAEAIYSMDDHPSNK